MDPYIVNQLFTDRRNDLVREAEESRLAREGREEAQPEPRPTSRPARARGLGFAR